MVISAVSSVFQLEAVLQQFEQTDLPLGHYHIDGVYVRAMLIPQGTILTGKIHNHECISIVAKGEITVNDGTGDKLLKAGWIGISQPGIKRAGFAHEDTVFITVHRCDETELDKIESLLVSESFEEFERRLLQ